jgi:hypothetical protein
MVRDHRRRFPSVVKARRWQTPFAECWTAKQINYLKGSE